MMATDLQELIAQAIKDADKKIFNEDYGKQALAVLSALRRAGFEIVPNKATEGLIDFTCNNLPFGRLKQQEFIRELYLLMVENARRYE